MEYGFSFHVCIDIIITQNHGECQSYFEFIMGRYVYFRKDKFLFESRKLDDVGSTMFRLKVDISLAFSSGRRGTVLTVDEVFYSDCPVNTIIKFFLLKT